MTHSTPHSRKNKQQIYAGFRVVGYVSGDTFKKSIDFSRHALKQPPAIAFDLSTLDDAETLGAVWVEVKDRETGRVYRATIVTIRRVGFSVNRGFGAQIGLPLAYFSIDGQPPKNTSQTIKTASADIQPRLF